MDDVRAGGCCWRSQHTRSTTTPSSSSDVTPTKHNETRSSLSEERLSRLRQILRKDASDQAPPREHCSSVRRVHVVGGSSSNVESHVNRYISRVERERCTCALSLYFTSRDSDTDISHPNVMRLPDERKSVCDTSSSQFTGSDSCSCCLSRDGQQNGDSNDLSRSSQDYLCELHNGVQHKSRIPQNPAHTHKLESMHSTRILRNSTSLENLERKEFMTHERRDRFLQTYKSNGKILPKLSDECAQWLSKADHLNSMKDRDLSTASQG